MTWDSVAALGTALIAALVTVYNGRKAYLAQRLGITTSAKVQQAEADTGAGELALSMVKEMRPRLANLEQYHEAVGYWWNEEHYPRDRMLERELSRLDPGFQLPAAAPIPRLQRVSGPQT